MVQVVRAGKADETTLDNLLQLYLYEFSAFDGSQRSSDGRFEYPYLAQYWDKPDHHDSFIGQFGARSRSHR